MEKANWIIEILLGLNRLILNVILAPVWNLIDERSLRGPYGNSRYTLCGTVGEHYREKYHGKIPWRHPVAAMTQHLTEFWYRDKHHTREAATHEQAADV